MKLKYIILIVLFISTICNAQSADQMLLNIQNNFNKFDTFKADFRQSTVINKNDNSLKIEGEFYFKKESKYKIEFQNQRIISDGVTVWNYNSLQKRVIINNVVDEPSAFSLRKFVFEYPKKCNMSLEKDEGSTVLVLVPHMHNLGFKKAKLWINENNLIRKVIITDNTGTKYQVVFSNYVLNPKFEDSFFTFEQKEGIQVIDFR